MTPEWLSTFKEAERQRDRDAMERLATARCFDIGPVSQLVADVCEDLWRMFRDSAIENERRELLVDCGVDVVIPGPRIWVEGFENARWPVPLFCEYEEATKRYHLTGPRGYDLSFETVAHIEFGDGGVLHATLSDFGHEDGGTFAAMVVAQFFSFLAVVSSPRASGETFRRTFAVRQKMRKLGLRAIEGEIKHTRVFIRVGERNVGTSGMKRTSSPKAYHFCRAHLRHKADGRVERVRAHWRGDPAFGIRLPTYEVRNAA